jgi:hypothetical protein
MKTLHTNDLIKVDGMDGIVLTADIMDDGVQYITALVEGATLPIIVDNNGAAMLSDCTDYCESYADAGRFQWCLVDMEIL